MSKRYLLILGDERHERVSRRAMEMGISMSDFVRLAIDNALDTGVQSQVATTLPSAATMQFTAGSRAGLLHRSPVTDRYDDPPGAGIEPQRRPFTPVPKK